MKIQKIKYSNFRNFKSKGEFSCSTDGKVTIIYGRNGTGKTTLHQLFQWIFYGVVHFNKTTSERKLYNTEYESKISNGTKFEVYGEIEFSHDENQYVISRTNTYIKSENGSKLDNEEVSLLKYEKESENWCPIKDPKETVEKLLPSGVSDYLFFDGENMIADLKTKSKKSAKKFKNALYSMFDLDILDNAISHIGKIENKTTVLGSIFLKKGDIKSNSQIPSLDQRISDAHTHYENIKTESNAKKTKQKENLELIKNISEAIGSFKSTAELEFKRESAKKEINNLSAMLANEIEGFGIDVSDMFPMLLISKAVEEADRKMKLEISKNELPMGLTKQLVHHLISESTHKCICGNTLDTKSKEHIEYYLSMLPPESYTSLYNEFRAITKEWSRRYNKNKIENHLTQIATIKDQISSREKDITDIDEKIKELEEKKELAEKRQHAEEENQELQEQIENLSTEIRKAKALNKKLIKELDEITKHTEKGKEIDKKIDIMNEVKSLFENELNSEAKQYSDKLQENIQKLINVMIEEPRAVEVNNQFAVSIKDEYGDESKSEGQFAVASFAYIGGILKLLEDEEKLKIKEYPLVLDGPFSKLDRENRKNVVNQITKFAPQVIIFSKDNLHDVFDDDEIGETWHISCNKAKNVATVESGSLWK